MNTRYYRISPGQGPSLGLASEAVGGRDSEAIELGWRAESRAQFQGRSYEDVMATQLDARGPTVPELPEAALRLGEYYLAGPLLTPDGRSKLVVSGTAEEVLAFRDSWAPANGLTGVYAMPERGMGGGYLS